MERSRSNTSRARILVYDDRTGEGFTVSCRYEEHTLDTNLGADQ